MQNYEILIMDKLKGDTPRQKYEYLQEIIQMLAESIDAMATVEYEQDRFISGFKNPKMTKEEHANKIVNNLKTIIKNKKATTDKQ